jgi:3-oxoacyl-[acyl-carrier protein] reductase
MQCSERKVALVTGAAQGIGAAIALELGRRMGRRYSVRTINERCRTHQRQCLKAAVQRARAVVWLWMFAILPRLMAGSIWSKRSLAVYVLVNNAGITRDNLAMRMKDEEWDAVLIPISSRSSVSVRAVMRGMMKARARAHHQSFFGCRACWQCRAGQLLRLQSRRQRYVALLARELGSRNITVNCVAPGFIDTDMTKVLEEKQRAALVANVPLGRLGQPEDIAAAVAFWLHPRRLYHRDDHPR